MGRKWQEIRILFTATLVFVVGAIEDCIGGVQSEESGFRGGYECRLSVKTLAICQLAVNAILTL